MWKTSLSNLSWTSHRNQYGKTIFINLIIIRFIRVFIWRKSQGERQAEYIHFWTLIVVLNDVTAFFPTMVNRLIISFPDSIHSPAFLISSSFLMSRNLIDLRTAISLRVMIWFSAKFLLYIVKPIFSSHSSAVSLKDKK